MAVFDISDLDFSKNYTYFDYLGWHFQERVELIKGKILKMSPAPSRRHQDVAQTINLAFSIFLKDQPCKVYFAPFDVRLERNQNDKKVINVVQPDICVICDLTKLDERGCSGPPELIVEILSPGNSSKEMKYKFELYETAKVNEYWIVDPTEKVIFQYFLENDQFTNRRPLIEGDTIYSKVLKNFSVNLTQIFKD